VPSLPISPPVIACGECFAARASAQGSLRPANKKTARRRSQSLPRDRYWVALKIWSAWANRNQSQNPVTATKAPEKTRLERRFCVILQPKSSSLLVSQQADCMTAAKAFRAQTVSIRLEVWARLGLKARRNPDRGDDCPSAGLQICRSLAALSPVANLCPTGDQSGPLALADWVGRAAFLSVSPGHRKQ